MSGADTTGCCAPGVRAVSAGTTQDERAPAALDPASAPLDDRDVGDRLAWMTAYARLLPLVDLTGQRVGTLAALLERDPAFLAAEIGRSPVPGGATPAEKLSALWTRLGELSARAPTGTQMGALLDAWREHAAPKVSAAQAASASQQEVEAVIQYLNSVLHSGQARGPGWLADALERWDRHAPQAALLIAFVELLEEARAVVNDLVARHHRYAVEQVLGFAPRPAEPDAAHVLLTPSRAASRAVIPAGTRFPAGKADSGEDRVYVLERELIATRARVESARAVVVRHGPGERSVRRWPAQGASADGAGLSWGALAGKDPGAHAAEVGFEVRSPLLWMAEGTREIELTLDFASAPSEDRRLRALVSTEDGWYQPKDGVVTIQAGKQSRTVVVTLQPEEPPIVGVDGAVPAVRLLATGGDARPIADIVKLGLIADVMGVTDLVVEGPSGRVEPGAPFAPFGPAPGPGDALFIGSWEAFSKPVRVLNLQWRQVEGAPLPALVLERAAGVGHPTWTVASTTNAMTEADKAKDQCASRVWTPPLATAEPDAPRFSAYAHEHRWGFVRLRPDAEARSAGQVATVETRGTSSTVTVAGASPPAQIDGLTLSYAASSDTDSPRDDVKIRHVLPFGCGPWLMPAKTRPVSLLPPLRVIDTGAAPLLSAALEVGLAGLELPEQVSLLVQVDPTASDPDVDPPDVTWAVLTADGWRALQPGEVVEDATGGLTRPGIARLRVPEDAATADGLVWIRAAAARDATLRSGPAGLCDVVAVHANAARVARSSPPGPDAQPLPAGTISRASPRPAALQSVEQPYPGRGGRRAEDHAGLSLRAAERVRHRGRASAPWDVERLVLDGFPEVARVRCLSHTRPVGQRLIGRSPGHLTVVVVPHPHAVRPSDRLTPRLRRALRADIARELGARASAFAQVHVVDPIYEAVTVTATIRVWAGVDDHEAQRRINAALEQALAPWTGERDDAPGFAAEVFPSQLVSLIDGLDDVDAVLSFRLSQVAVGGGGQVAVARPSTPRSVLTSGVHVSTIVPGGVR